jgi:hypothetical protein
MSPLGPFPFHPFPGSYQQPCQCRPWYWNVGSYGAALGPSAAVLQQASLASLYAAQQATTKPERTYESNRFIRMHIVQVTPWAREKK